MKLLRRRRCKWCGRLAASQTFPTVESAACSLHVPIERIWRRFRP